MSTTKIFDKKSGFFFITAVVLYIGLIALLLSDKPKVITSNNFWSAEKQRAVANKLKSVGLMKESAAAYEVYISNADLTPQERSGMAYTIAQIYMDAKLYEKALEWFYQVEISYPETDLKSKISSNIITCLEKLGHHTAAEYALEARASRQQTHDTEGKGGRVIARIGTDEITLNEINEAFEDLPKFMKAEIKKEEFAKAYIADQLFYREGAKLGFEQDPEIRRKTERLRKQLIINKVKEKEIESQIRVDPDDVKNYFEANKIKYQDPNSQQEPKFGQLQSRVEADYTQQKREKAYQIHINQALSTSEVQLFLDQID
ncbi:MAG: hypothetical protein ACMUIP_05595 [bacterium]